jgi:hypothetical protein
MLREVVAPLRPRLVVWAWFEGNDLSNLHLERAQRRLMAYLDPSYRVGPRVMNELVLRRWMDSVLSVARTHSRPGMRDRVRGVLALTRLRRQWRLQWPDNPPDEDLELVFRVIRRARADTEAWGAHLVVAYLPAWQRFYAPRAYRPRRDDVLAAAHQAGVPVIDVEPAFEHASDPAALFSRGRWMLGHYSVAGYRLAAEVLDHGLDSLMTAYPAASEHPPADGHH